MGQQGRVCDRFPINIIREGLFFQSLIPLDPISEPRGLFLPTEVVRIFFPNLALPNLHIRHYLGMQFRLNKKFYGYCILFS
jgi:hypothetical protein